VFDVNLAAWRWKGKRMTTRSKPIWDLSLWRLVAALAIAGFLAGPPAATAQSPEATKYDALVGAQHYGEAQKYAEQIYNAAVARNDETNIIIWGQAMADADLWLGRLDRAEGLSRRALDFFNRVAPGGTAVGNAQVTLGEVYRLTARYEEAESILRQAVATMKGAVGTEHTSTAYALHRLSNCLSDLGRYGEEEPLLRQALAIARKTDGPTHHTTLTIWFNLALVLGKQQRLAEEEAILRELLDVCHRSLAADDPFLVSPLSALASSELGRGKFQEAEALYRRAIEISIKNHGGNTPEVARLYDSLAGMKFQQGKEAEGDTLRAKALAILETAYGPDHPQVAALLFRRGALLIAAGKDKEAYESIDRCVRILERTGADPDTLSQAYYARAFVTFELGGRGQAAFDDLRASMDLSEAQRSRGGGGALERASVFGKSSGAFESMVYYQGKLGAKGDTAEAFAAMERFHARALLDEMRKAGAGRHTGRPDAERQALEARSRELESAVTVLEGRISVEKDKARRDALGAELAAARHRLYAHDRAAEVSDPVYRRLLSQSARLPTLADLRRDLLGPGDMFIEYLVGKTAGHALVVTSDSATIFSGFGFTDEEAKIMGVAPGFFNADRAHRAFLNDKGNGLIQQLADPRIPVPVAKLRVMWNTVTADPKLQKSLTDGTIKRLFIVPDGALALFPFEALVVNDGPEPVYLLDRGPQVIYVPSAAVLLSLAGRVKTDPPAGRAPVLAVGDPAYNVEPGDAGEAASPRSKFRAAAKGLSRLPFSGTEAHWVGQAFGEAGLKADLLTGAQATEAAVRAAAPGRRIVHFACHGLADEQYGNLFGALAFAPGPQGDRDPTDDGMMTLREIYGLDLRGNELAILSACQTNYGAEQMGEGTFALTRGFLVAGSRRVLASNWLVDDEAGASLVSAFCTQLARDEKARRPADHARSLQEAKRWLRGQPKWQAPYYWAGLVMVGPP
jgi:CHAT domain-containing protein/tetratricopeptide (TPR) repeat protein